MSELVYKLFRAFAPFSQTRSTNQLSDYPQITHLASLTADVSGDRRQPGGRQTRMPFLRASQHAGNLILVDGRLLRGRWRSGIHSPSAQNRLNSSPNDCDRIQRCRCIPNWSSIHIHVISFHQLIGVKHIAVRCSMLLHVQENTKNVALDHSPPSNPAGESSGTRTALARCSSVRRTVR